MFTAWVKWMVTGNLIGLWQKHCNFDSMGDTNVYKSPNWLCGWNGLCTHQCWNLMVTIRFGNDYSVGEMDGCRKSNRFRLWFLCPKNKYTNTEKKTLEHFFSDSVFCIFSPASWFFVGAWIRKYANTHMAIPALFVR